MRKGISAKVEQLVTEEAKKDAKLRGISFSRYVEVALIHELNKKSKRGSYAELLEIQKFVNDKIAMLEPELLEDELPGEVEVEEDADLIKSIHEISAIQEKRGEVTEKLLSIHATRLGYGTQEFQKLLSEHGVKLTIMDKVW